jgi:hypothetical protein
MGGWVLQHGSNVSSFAEDLMGGAGDFFPRPSYEKFSYCVRLINEADDPHFSLTLKKVSGSV